MARVMLLIPSASYRAPDFMAAAAELGIDVAVGCDVANPLDEASGGRQVALDFADIPRGTAQIEAYADRYPLDTILAVDDAGTRLAAHASRRLELPHNPVSAVEATRNKLELRKTLAASGVDDTPFAFVPFDTDPRKVAEELEYPVVVKPLSLSASRGVIRADDVDAFVDAFARVRDIVRDPANAAECGDLSDGLLVEAYIPGIEVSVEGLLTGGELHVLAIFDKPDPLEGPYFAETIYVTPSRLPADTQAMAADAVARATAALGLRDGPVHAELRINDGGVHPVDIAARSIGGLCSRTLSFGTGMSLEEIILRHATGAGVPSFEREQQAAGVMMLPMEQAGTLREVRGMNDAEAVPLIESVTISKRPGSTLTPLPESGDYLGFIFARGAEPAAVEAALREAAGHLDVVVEQP